MRHHRVTTALLTTMVTAALLTSGLTAQGYDFLRAAKLSESEKGQALLIQVDGKTVFERYANGGNVKQLHRLASATKSINGYLALRAEQDGLLKLDERVADVITEWRRDLRKSKITYRLLLSLSSGLTGGQTGNIPTYADSIKEPTIADPGKKFSYGPVPFQVFGEALKRKLKPKNLTVAAWVKQVFLDPLGITRLNWRRYGTGEPDLPSGLELTARDLVKYAELVRNDGVYGGKRLLRAGRFAECFKRSAAANDYGLTFWLPTPSNEALPRDSAYMSGSGKQRVYVVPSHRMSIVRYADGGAWGHDTFFATLMPTPMTYGSGVLGSGKYIPTLTTGGQAPKIGNSAFRFESRRVLGGAPGMLLLSARSAEIAFLGGTLWVDASVALPIPWVASGPKGTPGAGTATLRAGIPLVPSLVNEQFFLQAGFTDAAALGGISLTKGLFVRIHK